jgi:hypothetical protein
VVKFLSKILTYDSIEIACLIAWIALLLPALMYLLIDWRIRRKVLLDHFNDEAIRLYYKQFSPFSPARPIRKRMSGDEGLQVQLRRDFDSRYGRRHYILPLLLLAVISGIGMWATARSVQTWLGIPPGDPKVPTFTTVTISAFLGGYAWVLLDQFSRFRTGDFTYHDVYQGVYRLLIAIPLGLSLATFSNLQVAAGFAFLLAGFPTATLFKFGRRLAAKSLGVGESDERGLLELEKLQCVGRANAERYLDEGVTTIAELAWADPIDLTIRTNREFNYVVDCISQALLWVYFEDDVKKLFHLSLRGAQDVSSFMRDLKALPFDSPPRGSPLHDTDFSSAYEAEVAYAAQQTLTTGAARLNLNEETFKYTLWTVAEDPYTEFLVSIWAQIKK